MKVIPLSEAKAKLSRYGQICHKEPVVITVNGRPSFQLVPLGDDDDLLDQLLRDHPGFRRLVQSRLKESAVPAAEVARRFGVRAKGSSGNNRSNRSLRSRLGNAF